MRHEQSSLRVIVVLPEGTFRDTRREVEAKLGTIDEGFAAPLMLTEDYAGAWTRTFGATNTPATYLLDARRELVWKQQGEMSPAALAAALDQHLLPTPPPRSRPLRLTVRPGDRALDALLDDDEGQTLALRRFRGERVSLHFWQSWSAPCIRELRRLQRLRDGSARPPVVIAVNGGEAREVIAETRRQNDLTFTLVHDSDRRITRLYGVRCWPTTVSIDADGIVERIQFGAAHEHAAEGRAETPEAS
jgi:peroxiredoxin